MLLIKPFVEHFGLSLGMAVSFSLTAAALCLSSLILLSSFLGKKLAAVLLGNIVMVTAGLGLLLSGLPV